MSSIVAEISPAQSTAKEGWVEHESKTTSGSKPKKIRADLQIFEVIGLQDNCQTAKTVELLLDHALI